MSNFVFADYNIDVGLVLKHKAKPDVIGIVSKCGTNPFGDDKTYLYEVSILSTGRRMIYNLKELGDNWEYCQTLQVLYGN